MEPQKGREGVVVAEVGQELESLLVQVHSLLFHTQVQGVKRVVNLIKKPFPLDPFPNLGDGVVEEFEKAVGE